MSVDLTNAVAGSAWRTGDGWTVWYVEEQGDLHVFSDGGIRCGDGSLYEEAGGDYDIVEYIGPPYEELLARLADAEAELARLREASE